jgi:hypothetical protein
MIRDLDEGFVGLLFGQSAGVDSVAFEKLHRSQCTRSLVSVPVRVIGNNVVSIGGSDLVKVAPANVMGVLRLIDRRFQKMLVEDSVVAAVPLYGLIVEIINDFARKELGLPFKIHRRRGLALPIVFREPAKQSVVKGEHLAFDLPVLLLGNVAGAGSCPIGRLFLGPLGRSGHGRVGLQILFHRHPQSQSSGFQATGWGDCGVT